MKKLILVLLVLNSALLVAQPGPIEGLDKPQMIFETEVIDYGTIEQGSNGEREFKFTNKGYTHLIISEAKKSCGCAVPSFPKEPIKPGESAVIKVKYDTNRLGVINKTVTIISNAERPSIVLRIKGKVVAHKASPIKDNNILKAN